MRRETWKHPSPPPEHHGQHVPSMPSLRILHKYAPASASNTPDSRKLSDLPRLKHCFCILIDLKMARLAVTAAVLALLFVAASATYRTTITTVEFDEEEANPGRRGGGGSGSQQCRERVSRQQLRQCEKLITQGRGYIVLPRHEGEQEHHLQQCCQQLRRMDPQCRCEGLKQIVQEQQQGELQGEEIREMVQKAQNLPNKCRLSPERCEISTYGGGY